MLFSPQYDATSARSEMVRFVTNNPKRSLEIGCRQGLFSKKLSEKFNELETWGIEPDQTPIAEARKNLYRILQGSFPDAATHLPQNYFDLIIFNDVLEHLYDPWAALEHCHNLLSPTGIIVASIPNIRLKSIIKDLILYDNFEYQTAGNLDISHIRFFTRKTMEQLFQKTGFHVTQLEPVRPIKNPFKRFWIFLTCGWMESFYVSQYGITATINKVCSMDKKKK